MVDLVNITLIVVWFVWFRALTLRLLGFIRIEISIIFGMFLQLLWRLLLDIKIFGNALDKKLGSEVFSENKDQYVNGLVESA